MTSHRTSGTPLPAKSCQIITHCECDWPF